VTHILRTSSCVIAKANGASEARIRRGGRWSNEKIKGCFMTTLPREVDRALAGFIANGGEFFLPRAESCISETLRGAKAYPNLPIWKHALFTGTDYQGFGNQQLALLQRSSDTELIPTVRAALPILTSVRESHVASTLVLAPVHAGQSNEQAKPLGEPVLYRLARGLKSVVKVWTEYIVVGCTNSSHVTAKNGVRVILNVDISKGRKLLYEAINFLAASEPPPPKLLEPKRKNVSLTPGALSDRSL
ncbi:putative centromere DNA-binding protein complex CBF3 subunit domain-containing protein, partial [Phytophthora infestans]